MNFANGSHRKYVLGLFTASFLLYFFYPTLLQLLLETQYSQSARGIH